MFIKSLTTILRRGFKFNFFKEKPKEKSIEEILDQSENLGHYIQSIRQANLRKPKLLPPKQDNKLTVVFELDQVLSYTFTPNEEGYLSAPLRNYDHYTEFPEYDAYLSIYKRKNLHLFLKYVVQECEPVLWTTGVKSYMDIILQYIDPENRLPYKFHQEHCNNLLIPTQDIDQYIKDLNLLGRDLRRVIYIDCHPFSFWPNPQNCIPMSQFRADNTMEDEDLGILIRQIQELKQSPDVRVELQKWYGLKEILESAKML